MNYKCWRIGIVALAVAASASGAARAETNAAYEVDGRIHLRLHKPNGDVWKDFRGDFKVFVNGSAWMIQTIETNDWGTPLRREIGTANGVEMYELTLPYVPLDVPVAATSVWGPPHTGDIAIQGTICPSAIPVGNLDSSFSGHLWLMFASGNYFRTATPGKLVPVFGFQYPPMISPSMAIRADWEVMQAQGDLPLLVKYYEQGDAPTAVYTVSAFSNAGIVPVPAKIHFEQPLRHYKDVDIEVTATRAGCSRTNFIPKIQGKILVVDFRPGSANCVIDHWPTVAEAKAIYTKLNPPKPPEPARPEVKLPVRDLAKLVTPRNQPFVPFSAAMIDQPQNGGPAQPEQWLFKTDDLKWPMVFCLNLAEHDRLARERRESNYTLLWNRLSTNTQAILAQFQKQMSGPGNHTYQAGPELDAIVNNLNALVKTDSSYDAGAIPERVLSGDTVKLIAEKPQGAALARLNRLLLEDAFSADLVRAPKLIADPASKLTASVVFHKDRLAPETFADIALLDEDGKPLWTATVNPRELVPGSGNMGRTFGMEGIWDVQFEQNDIIVRYDGKFSAALDLKTGTLRQLPNT